MPRPTPPTRRRAFVAWLLACAAAWACASTACAAPDPDGGDVVSAPRPVVRSDEDGDWVLVLDEGFDGDAVDPARWFARGGPLRHAGTLNSASKAMLEVRGGSLFVSATPTPGEEQPYTGGYLDTDGRFAQTYGKIEFRMRGQFAPGLWYAVWGRPWFNPVPEIDVELLAEDVNQVWFVSHWALPPLPADERRSYATLGGLDVRDHHTYAIVWTPEMVEWKVDGRVEWRVTGRGVPHEPIFWILNTWVGGWAGEPRAETIFPAHFEVDFFRVYRHAAWLSEPAIRVRNPREGYSVGDTIDAEIADFDAGAVVEVWEGDRKLETLARAPYKLSARRAGRGRHSLTFVGTDGARRAATSLDVVVY